MKLSDGVWLTCLGVPPQQRSSSSSCFHRRRRRLSPPVPESLVIVLHFELMWRTVYTLLVSSFFCTVPSIVTVPESLVSHLLVIRVHHEMKSVKRVRSSNEQWRQTRQWKWKEAMDYSPWLVAPSRKRKKTLVCFSISSDNVCPCVNIGPKCCSRLNHIIACEFDTAVSGPPCTRIAPGPMVSRPKYTMVYISHAGVIWLHPSCTTKGELVCSSAWLDRVSSHIIAETWDSMDFTLERLHLRTLSCSWRPTSSTLPCQAVQPKQQQTAIASLVAVVPATTWSGWSKLRFQAWNEAKLKQNKKEGAEKSLVDAKMPWKWIGLVVWAKKLCKNCRIM